MCQNSSENMGAGSFSCCEPKNFVQDKVCNDFTVSGIDEVGAEIIYATNANDVIFASGFVKNVGNFPITVQFVKGANPTTGLGGTIVRQAVVPIGGAFTFTISRFDTIRVFATDATAALPAAGEFCITPRYEIG
ncbi:DUF3992 domain-containing protein [Sporosarcina sp. BP05]|uniref:DUF3992 domain-containing protein n=1 Tax=Sporosarcina sp. BP05 TaxID=2758726 RepID=UPI001648659E|nr:S-Ena type endospore appendage [Sporosarcina sp. BP05]